MLLDETLSKDLRFLNVANSYETVCIQCHYKINIAIVHSSGSGLEILFKVKKIDAKTMQLPVSLLQTTVENTVLRL